MKWTFTAVATIACINTALAEEYDFNGAVRRTRRQQNDLLQDHEWNMGPTACPNAQYVMVRDVEGLKEILAAGLAAKLAGSNVRFQGTCHDSEYFSAFYIIVE